MPIAIQICNWLLTRRCNLRCDYCRLVRDYAGKPEEYPDMSYFYKNEISPDEVISLLQRLSKHNKNMFHIFYGGEPTLYNGLIEVIDFCNKNNIYYTIITNSTEVARRKIIELVSKVGTLRGLTASVDPVLIKEFEDDDIHKKSHEGFRHLIDYKDIVEDLVAEITCTSKNFEYLLPLVCKLSLNGIWSSITMIELTVSKYYDFSNCTDKSLRVTKTMAYDTLMLLKSGSYKIHMKEKLLPVLYKYLPQLYDCKIGKIPFHNLTIDADGSPRLCLRIRGIKAPSKKMTDYISKEGNFSESFLSNMVEDYQKLCRRCIWTCPMMSEIVLKDDRWLTKLYHTSGELND